MPSLSFPPFLSLVTFKIAFHSHVLRWGKLKASEIRKAPRKQAINKEIEIACFRIDYFFHMHLITFVMMSNFF